VSLREASKLYQGENEGPDAKRLVGGVVAIGGGMPTHPVKYKEPFTEKEFQHEGKRHLQSS